MDRQLMGEFNKMYFGKNQLKRRIYDKEELEIIWKSINVSRKKEARNIEMNLNEENNIWYNITDDIKSMIEYINDIKRSEIIKYLIGEESINNSLLIVNKECEINSCKLLSIKNIEEFYRNTYMAEDKDNIYRVSNYDILLGELSYEPYKISDSYKLKEILESLFRFIERDKSTNTIIKAAILNFYIIYLNPFEDHNIEMAQYITNAYLIDNGYEIICYCRHKELIKADERRYYNAIQNSILSEGDLTYFIKYYVAIIQNAIREITNYIAGKYGKKIIKELLDKSNVCLEDRQIKFINNMVVLTNNKISIDDYKKKSKVSYETARSDLNELVALGFFKINKSGKKYEYYFNDITTIIEDFNEINMSF